MLLNLCVMFEKENRYYSAPFGLPLPLSSYVVR